ncbi:sensor histidine kinase [Galbitalea soli]|uniref:histidine kinase n=1 Tax=Galbitalea soli TaxID=1268042 RepID=A0A7C9PLQ0_9MICO|nr:sensor histidine kinase [Galbitalea soli]NEM90345.1 sensor histidine kinase [Galbitalea soli]NYJ31054.1 signal transduction histidine kinase [Galbitalea soli]
MRDRDWRHDEAWFAHAHAFGRPPGGGSPRARLWIPVVVSLVVQVPAVFFIVARRELVPLDHTGSTFWLALALALVGPIALIGARRWPGPVVAVVTAAACASIFVGNFDNSPPYISLAFAIVGAIVRGARPWAWISIATGWVITLSIAIATGAHWNAPRIAATTLGILIVIGIGESTRSRRERFRQLARARAERQQTEVQAERVRIARELHDVLAHSLSQINVQAGVGLHLMDGDPDKARDALANIKETSKTALDEVRSVLGVLRSGRDADAPLVPEPDLARLPALADSVRDQGIDVALGSAPDGLPQATQLALYRIVQESLTNVVRHARASRARVEFDVSDEFYSVTITDDGVSSYRADTEGRGLLGMRERAELLGGTLEAGPSPHGGFRVQARIPVRTRVGAP